MDQKIYQAYVDILREELIPATGCTEPIAVAYAGALAKKALGALPERVELTVSGNIIKNVKSVLVPHTAGRKGLRTAVAAGICCGNADKELEVLSDVTAEALGRMDDFLSTAEFVFGKSTANCPFDIQVRLFAGDDSSYVRMIGHHTNVVRIEKNGEILLDKPFSDEVVQAPGNRTLLTVE